MQNNFYGIELYNETTVEEPEVNLNETSKLDVDDLNEIGNFSSEELQKHVTNMKSVKMIVLQFRAEHQLGWNDKDVKEYEMSVVRYFEK